MSLRWQRRCSHLDYALFKAVRALRLIAISTFHGHLASAIMMESRYVSPNPDAVV
jgi:hypothetical protein